MPAIRTNRKYPKLSDTELSKFLGGTSKGFKGNVDLLNPPVVPADLDLLKEKFDKSILAAYKGGNLLNAIKNAVRAEVINALDKNASYVDINCNDSIPILISSGYQAVSTNRAQTMLEPPVIKSAEVPQKGKIKLSVKSDRNRRSIVGRIKKVSDTEFGPVVTFKGTKDIIFSTAEAGVMYVMELMGLGGSTGQSDWSEPVTKMGQ